MPEAGPGAEARRRPRRAWLAAAAAYGALAPWSTWPLAYRLSDHVVDTVALRGPFGWVALADIRLVAWALAWDVHALVHTPSSLFDANVFYPARWALARSDHFLGNLPFFAPLYLASHNPVLAHQGLLLLTFPLSALAMYVAVARWTGSAAAGFVAGLQFGFGPWRFAQLGHVQLVATFYFPLLLLCTGEAVRTGRRGPWLGVLVLGTLQALSSVYLAFAAFAATAAMLVGTWWAGPAGSWRRAGAAAGAVALAGVALLALSWPYIVLGRIGAIPRVTPTPDSLGRALELAAAHPLRTYLVPTRPGSADGYYFLGWLSAALAAVGAFAGGRAASDDRSRPAVHPRLGLLLVLLSGWTLSLGYASPLASGGTVTLPLGWLARLFPGFASLRGPLRLGVSVPVAAAALAGLGYAAIARRLPGRAMRAALLALVGLASVIEATPRAVPLRQEPVGTHVPETYRWLAAQPAGPVLELPVGFLDHDFLGDVAAIRWQSGYLQSSTVGWWPLLNGYSGYPPESFFFLMAIARRLPAADALQDLVDLSGLRWLVVHRDALAPAARAAWDPPEADRGLRRRAAFGPDVVFEVALPARRDLRSLLRDEARRPYTLNGLSREPLPASATRGRLVELHLPPVVVAEGVHQAVVTIENGSGRPWPGFDPWREGLIGLAYRWRAADGTTTPGTVYTRVGTDLAPGASLRAPFALRGPRAPGRYELVVTLRQDGGLWFDEAGGAAVRAAVDVQAWPFLPPSDGPRRPLPP